MEIVKTLSLKFSEEEKEILNQALELIDNFGKTDVCGALECDDCPFNSLCNYHEAEVLEQKINNLLCE